MNPIAEEILMHYGMPRRSGRYPWGSGENPYQHSGDFLSRIDELKSQGMSDTEIAKAMGLTTTQYRTQKSLAKDERRALDVARAKSLKIVKGTPATNPVKPSMIKTNDRWQYPLAYIRVNSGVTSIRQANITNTVGTSECPFVTAPLEKMSIDALVAQWKDQWDAFYEKETSDMEATNSFWKDQWSKWFNAQTEEIQQSYLDWEKQWNDWYATQTADMQETNAYWKQLWATWFNEYTNNNTSEMAAWRENAQALFDEWFQQLKDTLSENVEANLANQILELQERTKILEEIVEGIRTEFTVYNKLYDNGYENHDKLLDSSDGTIIDSDIDPIVARAYSSSLILDSNGQPIDGRVIFCIR